LQGLVSAVLGNEMLAHGQEFKRPE
jgi:hypothetical protein